MIGPGPKICEGRRQVVIYKNSFISLISNVRTRRRVIFYFYYTEKACV